MLNQHQKHILAVAILTVAAYSLPQVKDVFAETNTGALVCPSGYICRPMVEQPAGCPVGYICSKFETKSVSPSFKIEDTTSGKEEVKSSVSSIDQKKYCYTFNYDLDPRNLSNGVSIEKDSGVALFNLQTLLEDKENIDINNSERELANPVFGESTKLAVKEFQRKNGIPTTGYVGPMTRARLNKVYGCNNMNNYKPLIIPAGANSNVGPKPLPTPPVAEKTLYYANANITDVKIVNKTSGVQVTENTSVTKGETYTISWNASGVPESARFTLIFQSPSNPNIYGVLRTGYIDATKRSYDWKVEDYMLTNTDLRIGIEVGNVRAFSPSFKVIAGAVTNQPVTNQTNVQTGVQTQPSAVVVAPGIKSIYPSSGTPGTKVTLTLNNPKKSSVSLGDFNFGSYGLTNFTNSNNEVITFTVPIDAKSGYYDVIWWGDDAYVVKFNVILQTAPVSKVTGWHYVASVFDSVITLASFIM